MTVHFHVAAFTTAWLLHCLLLPLVRLDTINKGFDSLKESRPKAFVVICVIHFVYQMNATQTKVSFFRNSGRGGGGASGPS